MDNNKNNNKDRRPSILSDLIINFVVFLFVFMIISSISSNYFGIAPGTKNLHSIAKTAAEENYKKEKADKTSKLYRYNSDEFIEDMYTIAKHEAEKGVFYIEIEKPFVVDDNQIVYIETTKGLKETEYYVPEDMQEYVEDDTLEYLEKAYGLELDIYLAKVSLSW